MWQAARCFNLVGGLLLGSALTYFMATYGHWYVKEGGDAGADLWPAGPVLAISAMVFFGLLALGAGLIRSFPGIWSPPVIGVMWGLAALPDEFLLRLYYSSCLLCAILAHWLGSDSSPHHSGQTLHCTIVGNLVVPLVLCATFAWLLVLDIRGLIEYPPEV